MIGLEGDALTRYIMQSVDRHDRHVEGLAKKEEIDQKDKKEADRIAREREKLREQPERAKRRGLLN